MTTVALYARVSSERQINEDTVSPGLENFRECHTPEVRFISKLYPTQFAGKIKMADLPQTKKKLPKSTFYHQKILYAAIFWQTEHFLSNSSIK